MKNLNLIYLTIFLLLSNASNLFCDILNVPDLKYPTIQAGIDSASYGDTILVASGTYYENINFNGKNIVLCSEYFFSSDTAFIAETVLNGNANGCVVVFENGEDSTTVLCGFTITNGYAYSNMFRGGGITCINNSGPVLSNLIITKNQVDGDPHNNGGAGVFCKNKSNPILIDVKIVDNIARGSDGSAILCIDSTRILIKNSAIRLNRGSWGTLTLLNSWLNMDNVLIENNDTFITGAGIHLEQSEAIIKNSQILNNHVNQLGGGIYAKNASFIFDNIVLANNSATEAFDGGAGGGLLMEYNSNGTIVNSTINNNIAQGSGAGIEISGSSLHMKNVSIKSNCVTRDGNGGGINANNMSEIYLDYVKIINNYSPHNGGGIYCSDNNVIFNLSNVTICKNKAFGEGGGINFSSPNNLNFSQQYPSNIYLNKAGFRGADLMYKGTEIIEIVVDTITVSQPGDFHLYPRNKFNLNFLHNLFNSVDADLYVSSTGSDHNSGTSFFSPLRSINSALLFSTADSNNHRIIHIAQGTYSLSTTGEELPFYGRNNITLLGSTQDHTILDGESYTSIFLLNMTENFGIDNCIIQYGKADNGGAIYGDRISNIKFENLVFRQNSSLYRGSAIYLRGNIGTISDKQIIEFKDVLFHHNSIESSLYEGACIAVIGDAKIKFINVTLTDNYIVESVPESSQSAGLFNYGWYKSNLFIVNSIFNNNFPNNIIIENKTDLLVSYSNIPGGEIGSGFFSPPANNSA